MDGREFARRAEVLRPQSLLQQQGADGGVEGGGRHGDVGRTVARRFPQSVRSSDRSCEAVQLIKDVMQIAKPWHRGVWVFPSKCRKFLLNKS